MHLNIVKEVLDDEFVLNRIRDLAFEIQDRAGFTTAGEDESYDSEIVDTVYETLCDHIEDALLNVELEDHSDWLEGQREAAAEARWEAAEDR